MQSQESDDDLTLHLAVREQTIVENEEKLVVLFGAAEQFKCVASFIQH